MLVAKNSQLENSRKLDPSRTLKLAPNSQESRYPSFYSIIPPPKHSSPSLPAYITND